MLPAGRRKVSWLVRLAFPAAVAALAAMVVTAGSRPAVLAARGPGGNGWLTSWSASPQAAYPGSPAAVGLDDQTVRDIVFTSVGGDAVRLELTNAFGATALQVGRVTVAVSGPGAAVVPGTIHQATFGGRVSFQIPAGGRALSDPVLMPVWPLQDLAVSVYLPGQPGAATVHADAQQVNWISEPGDHAADTDPDAFATRAESWYYLSGVIVRSPGAAGTVVAFGDSITDGWRSAVDANARWPNDLARRLDALHGPAISVADEGLSGNQVLASTVCCGVGAEARFRQDVLDQPGVREVILLEGINDIGFHRSSPDPGAARIIAGYEHLIALARARGLKIFGATLLPFKGAGYYTPAGEAKREAVNAWIRTSHAFDGVIDFDASMRDPADPLSLNPAYDSGDHLHPNDTGYQVMADAVSLKMLLAGLTPRPKRAV